MSRLFTGIYSRMRRHRLLFWMLLVASALVWMALALQLKIEGDISRLMPRKSSDQRVLQELLGSTEASGRILVEIRDLNSRNAPGDESLFLMGDSLRSLLESKLSSWLVWEDEEETRSADQVVPMLLDHFPLFLEESDYEQMAEWLNPEGLEATMALNRERLVSASGPFWKDWVEKDPLGLSRQLWPRLQSLSQDTRWDWANGFLVSRQEPRLGFWIQPRYPANRTKENGELLEALSSLRTEWKSRNPGYDFLYFGAPLVAAGNALQIQKDTQLTLGLTLGLLLLVTWYYFRRKRASLYLLIPVAYGGLMGLGLTYLIQGSISGIALGAGALVMSIAVDFSIHYLSAARQGADPRTVISRVAQPLLLGSLTTIAAFHALRFTQTPILQDFGLFASLSLLGAALATLIILPQLPFASEDQGSERITAFDRMARIPWERRPYLVWTLFLLTPIMAFFSTKVRFDAEMTHLNFLTDDLREAEGVFRQSHDFTLGTIYAWAEGEDADQAREKIHGLRKPLQALVREGKVRSATLISEWIPPRSVQEEKWQRWTEFWEGISLDSIQSLAVAAARSQGLAEAPVRAFFDKVPHWPSSWGAEQEDMLYRMFPGSQARIGEKVYALASLKVGDEHRESVFLSLSNQGEWSLSDRKREAGALALLLTEDFSDIALWSSLIVFLALWLGYGRIELALISFLPLAMSWIWILGFMGLVGLPFNMVNMVISSLLFGLGDDYVIFIMDGLVERNKSRRFSLTPVKSAVYLSVTTVLIALGVLLLASHPALRSIAWVSVGGILCVLLISQVIQPYLFRILIADRVEKGWPPFTLRTLLLSAFAFSFFFLGSLFLGLLGWCLTRLRPLGKEGSMKVFHRAISRMSWIMMHIMGNVRKTLPPKGAIDPDCPAIYVANHSSFLDILMTTMIHPRLILLTNRWVWRSPVFGAVVRMAEYYPVEDSLEEQEGRLVEKVAQGYSLMIFPEGTRSADGKLGRFHKGAFYWSERLGIPVIPLVLHGAQYIMTKGDWMLKDGHCSIHLGPEIPPDDHRWGKDYQQKTRRLRQWMRERMDRIRQEVEKPAYFRYRFHKAYTYKGPVLEWYARIKGKMEGYYQQFDDILPREGRIYDLGCGYGFLSWILQWTAPDREFIGVDYDEEKVRLAEGIRHGEKGAFHQADILDFPLEPAEGILLLDVLHYLVPEDQQRMLDRAYRALKPGGVLVIRDGVVELGSRIKGTQITEWFSTRLIGFNKRKQDLHYLSSAQLVQWARSWGAEAEVRDPGGMTANLIFIVRRPLGGE